MGIPDLSRRSTFFSLAFFALLALLLYQIGLMLQPFLFPALWAGLLAHAVYPLHHRLTKLLRGNDMAAAALLTAASCVLVAVPLVVLGVFFLEEAVVVEQTMQAWVSAGGFRRLPDQLATVPLIGGWLRAALSGHGVPASTLEQWALSGAKLVSGFLVDHLGGFLKDAVILVTRFFVMLFILFFACKDGHRWVESLHALIPMDGSHKRKILERLDTTVRAVLKGMLVTAVVQGGLAGLAYFALGVPFPMVLTVLTVLLAPIPFGGTGLVWGPVVLYLLWVGPIGKALVMLAWGVGAVSMADHVLRPWLISQGTQLSPLLLALSVLGGLGLYGMIGIFVGPILVSLLATAMQIYREEFHPSLSEPSPSR